MKRSIFAALMITLLITGCGKAETTEAPLPDTAESEAAAETTPAENSPEDTEETEPDWMKREIIRPEGAEEWDDVEEEEPEAEIAEIAEGAALKAELEEKYGFEVRNLEDVPFLTYLNYEEVFDILETEIYSYKYYNGDNFNATYVEFIPSEAQLSTGGGRCPFVIEGAELMSEGATLYLSYNDGYYNVAEVTRSKP